MENQTVIFIPDISGFAKFVTKTELEPSNHIISELIEVIINSNMLNLTISEIEGDAVLFYLKGKPLKMEDIINQSEKMFIDFQTNLNEIEWNPSCKCEACSTTSNLTLKFITHYGEI